MLPCSRLYSHLHCQYLHSLVSWCKTWSRESRCCHRCCLVLDENIRTIRIVLQFYFSLITAWYQSICQSLSKSSGLLYVFIVPWEYTVFYIKMKAKGSKTLSFFCLDPHWMPLSPTNRKLGTMVSDPCLEHTREKDAENPYCLWPSREF